MCMKTTCTNNRNYKLILFAILGEAYVGEFLYPGDDCSDILNREQDADDGFYWITLKTATKRKVCIAKLQLQNIYMYVGVRPDVKS